MSDATAALTVVWTGRGATGEPRALDGWNTTAEDLAARLRDATELVVADPLSFPWRHVPSDRRAVPLTVTLPHELDADEIIAVLGRPVLRHLTRHDRLVEDRPEVRSRLTEVLELPESVWAGPQETPDGVPRHIGKARVYEAVAAVRSVVRASLPESDLRPLVGFLGPARELEGLVSSTLGTDHSRYPLVHDPAHPEPPTPNLLVVWLPDGGQRPDDRRATLERARDLLHPGGVVVVLGYVVTAPGGAANPSLSQLVEELGSVWGGMLHVNELRSVHWQGESLTRGVAVGATSLRGGMV